MNRREFLKASGIAALAAQRALRPSHTLRVGDRVTFTSGTKVRHGRIAAFQGHGQQLARLTHVDDPIKTAKVSVIPIRKLTKVGA